MSQERKTENLEWSTYGFERASQIQWITDGELARVLMSYADDVKWVLQVEPLYFFLFLEPSLIGDCCWAWPATGVDSDRPNLSGTISWKQTDNARVKRIQPLVINLRHLDGNRVILVSFIGTLWTGLPISLKRYSPSLPPYHKISANHPGITLYPYEQMGGNTLQCLVWASGGYWLVPIL